MIAVLFLFGGVIALFDPRQLVLFRATNDIAGTPSGIIEGLSPEAARYYAISSLLVGAAVLILVMWPRNRDDNE